MKEANDGDLHGDLTTTRRLSAGISFFPTLTKTKERRERSGRTTFTRALGARNHFLYDFMNFISIMTAAVVGT